MGCGRGDFRLRSGLEAIVRLSDGLYTSIVRMNIDAFNQSCEETVLALSHSGVFPRIGLAGRSVLWELQLELLEVDLCDVTVTVARPGRLLGKGKPPALRLSRRIDKVQRVSPHKQNVALAVGLWHE